MGQRLVVDLVQNDKVVAAIYYHWSAYFASTIFELTKLSKAILAAEKEGKDKVLSIIEMLETKEEHKNYKGEIEVRCGGVRREELEFAKKMYPDHEFEHEHVSRNCGIIALTEEGIRNFNDWEEGLARINLATHEISNDVCLDPDPFELDADYEVDEYGFKYITRFNSGKITINGKSCDVDAFDCDCESIIKLAEFMDKEYRVYQAMHSAPENRIQ